MTEIEVTASTLIVDIKGRDKIWAMICIASLKNLPWRLVQPGVKNSWRDSLPTKLARH